MKAIVYNNNESVLSPAAQSVCLRSSYILFDRTAISGSVTQHIIFDSLVPIQSPIQKNKFIENYCEKTKEPLPEAAQAISLLKSLAKIKHKNKAQLVLESQLLKGTDDLYLAVVEEIREKVQHTGLLELRSLIDGETFGMYNPANDEVESEVKNRVPACKLLCLDLPDPEQGPELFFLPVEFFLLREALGEKVYALHDKEAGMVENGWLHKCFTFPNINLCTAVELKALRHQLEIPGAEFRKQGDEWMKKCATLSAQDSVDFFRNRVVGHAASLQAAIAQTDLIKHLYAAQQIAAKAEVFAGEIPFSMLWRFYADAKVIHKPTLLKLEEAKEKNPHLAGRVPVMVLQVPLPASNDKVSKKEGEEIPDVQPVKKFISVD